MANAFAWFVDDTRLTILTELPETARLQLCEWVEFHGGDPHNIPLCSTITRHVDRCAVEVTVIERRDNGQVQVDEVGRLVTRQELLQGETPPLPWPSILMPPALGALTTGPR